mmetsp:Transcript_16183/g.41244  ORF Transcript_16183/g.41244 Transcript_16183/m.41244 type:complete len:301 (-) Transcript_16183:2778-3680(-)
MRVRASYCRSVASDWRSSRRTCPALSARTPHSSIRAPAAAAAAITPSSARALPRESMSVGPHAGASASAAPVCRPPTARTSESLPNANSACRGRARARCARSSSGSVRRCGVRRASRRRARAAARTAASGSALRSSERKRAHATPQPPARPRASSGASTATSTAWICHSPLKRLKLAARAAACSSPQPCPLRAASPSPSMLTAPAVGGASARMAFSSTRAASRGHSSRRRCHSPAAARRTCEGGAPRKSQTHVSTERISSRGSCGSASPLAERVREGEASSSPARLGVRLSECALALAAP